MNLAEMLEIINTGKPFECEYVSYDARRKTGGALKKVMLSACGVSDDERNEKPKTQTKAQNHFANSTRNFFVVADGTITSAIRKVHIILILSVNGKKLKL